MTNNVIFAADARDAWALYRLGTVSYPGLTNNRKEEVKSHMEGFAYRIGADFQVMRVSRSWSVEDYIEGAKRTLDPRRGHAQPWLQYLEHHRHALEQNNTARPETYLAVRLRDATVDLAESVNRGLSNGLHGLIKEIALQLGFGDTRGLSREQLAQIMRLETWTASAAPAMTCSGSCAVPTPAAWGIPRWTAIGRRPRSSSQMATASAVSFRATPKCCVCRTA
jgi:AraC-like DNA-binding protein